MLATKWQGDAVLAADTEQAEELLFFRRGFARQCLQHLHASLRGVLNRHALIAVMGEHMAHFVAEHSGKLIWCLCNREQSAVHPDFSSGQGKGVGAVIDKHIHFPGARLGHARGDGIGDAQHILVSGGIGAE